jgi:hypothetical protein
LLAGDHNALIGSFPGAALHALFFFRNLVSTRLGALTDGAKAAACGFFILCTFALTLLTWTGPISLALATGGSAVTVAFFYLRGTTLRLVVCANAAVWTVNALTFQSPWRLAGGVLSMGGALLGAWRCYRLPPPAAGIVRREPPPLT